MTTIPHQLGPSTTAIHAGERVDPTTHALNTPLYQTATFAFDSAEEKEAAVDRSLEWEPGVFFYTRTGNPTTAALEGKLAALEGAEDATVGTSGMAAVSATLLSLLDAGDHLVASSDLFVITRVLLDDVLASKGIEITHVDVTDLAAVPGDPPGDEGPLRRVAVEPAHGHRRVPALATIAHEHGLTFVVDNTFLSPAVLRPLEHGPTSSSIRRRSGSVVTATPCRRRRRTKGPHRPRPLLPRRARRSGQPVQLVADHPRRAHAQPAMRQHSANAQAVAEPSSPRASSGWYPGLASHPHHESPAGCSRTASAGCSP